MQYNFHFACIQLYCKVYRIHRGKKKDPLNHYGDINIIGNPYRSLFFLCVNRRTFCKTRTFAEHIETDTQTPRPSAKPIRHSQ